MRVQDVIFAIEEFAPLTWQQSWDNSGLQVGICDQRVCGIVLTVDVTEECLDYAISVGANLIVSHHPLLFSPLSCVSDQTVNQRIVYRAIQNEVAIYSAHTNLDSAIGGINYRLAERVGLTDVTPLETTDVPGVGLGAVGQLFVSNTHGISVLDYIDFIKRKLNLAVVRYSDFDPNIVLNTGAVVALCGGSGGSMIEQAVEAGARIFITGDLKYGDFQRATARIILLDVGHWEGEAHAVEIFYDIITEKIHTFVSDFDNISTPQISKFNSNQVNYYL